jgi:hypothetical protein
MTTNQKKLDDIVTQPNLTLREYAAITLCVPASGIDWLDAMILKAKRDQFAGQMMAAMRSVITPDGDGYHPTYEDSDFVSAADGKWMKVSSYWMPYRKNYGQDNARFDNTTSHDRALVREAYKLADDMLTERDVAACDPEKVETPPPTGPYVDRICASSANYLRTTSALVLVDYAKAAMSQCNPTKGLAKALCDLADDIEERFDMNSPSTNPGMKSCIVAARAALATCEPVIEENL